MNPLAQLYTLADPVFFEDPARWRPDGAAFPLAMQAPPEGWKRGGSDGWVSLRPESVRLPPQGWKIHISATPANAEEAVRVAADYCFRNGITFKFLGGSNLVRAFGLKYAPRAASGKVVTLYPVDDHQLTTCLEDLDAELAGNTGPYILSDLRFCSGPLYVRYGGFAKRFCVTDEGERVLAIERPDGTLVPDERKPVFTVPDWVSVPDVLRPSLERRNATGATLDYRVVEALHFSNGGGVYVARRNTDDTEIVLKEARPHAGLSDADTDAVGRMDHEIWALRRLAGIDGIPAVHEVTTVWEHQFVAMDRVPGMTLQQWLARHYPLIGAAGGEAERAAYVQRAERIHANVKRLIERIHERGVVFADLHPANIIVDENDEVGLVDFEAAFEAGAGRTQHMGHAGFTSATALDEDIDRNALAILRLWFYLPLTSVLAIAPDKLDALVEVAAELFDLPADFATSITAAAKRAPASPASPVSALPRGTPEPADRRWRDSVAAAITVSAEPDRTDRLFPGDTEQFVTGGAGFAHGAAGVLWSLQVTGYDVDEEHRRWLLERADEPVAAPGFLDGAHGIAYVLDEFGHRDAAAALIDRSAEAVDQMRDVSYMSGLAGVGLHLLHLHGKYGSTGSGRSGDRLSDALRIALRLEEAVADGRAHGVDRPPGRLGRAADSGTHGGLIRGWSGPALFFLRLFEATGDKGWLDTAIAAVHRDLRLCVADEAGSWQVDGGFRRLPYLDVGSAGIAVVVDEILRHVDDDELEAAVAPLVSSCHSDFVMDANLFHGRAGLMGVNARLDRGRPGTIDSRQTESHLERLSWHALAYRGHVSFPGDGCSRLSMDFATGNAGVLVAAASVVDESVPLLPFLSV
ncbi:MULTISPECIES: class III lanthionine synthetase LanKC [Prauserella salsuginis group]|uniref:Class III lanthionine synthetase LanKC n=1 Tax=Prauserella salsuginis TaxID=387889 RepID=A0ABW6G7I6_9PSEU|nr:MULTISPECIES: class III lanthionine synthetase LanKC [Prauserella salsuginis group]MCR3719515.1 Protein kinase domain-containing protein [Prauserella flava]MCR3735471.1 Protein kinase domain-containing protein [Prauserella salsuginis]